MKFLVTGGAGFVGSHLVDVLLDQGDSVVVLDDLSTGQLGNLEWAHRTGRLEFVEGSTGDSELVEELVDSVDACYHLASAVGVSLVINRPLESLLRNVHGVENVLVAAARHRRRIVYTSTSEIYGKHSQGALTEHADRLLGPIQKSRWSYAISKGFGESLAFGLAREGAEAIVARLFNTTGPRQTGAYGMVVPRFVRQALEGEPLTVFGDGSQSRCFAHVQDTVDALSTLIEHDEAIGNAYNVGGDREVSILALAQKVIERTRSDSTIEHVPFEDAYGDGFEELGRRRPDTTALTALTGWESRLTLEEVIDDTVEYERIRKGLEPVVVNAGRRSKRHARWGISVGDAGAAEEPAVG
jgi:nucleoside-diphosphate-sugar epimerase